MTIKVSLVTSATPPVTVKPATENINSGNQTIEWVPDSNQPAFTFVGVTFPTAPSGQFSAPSISTDPVCMTVIDNNNSQSSKGNFPYTLTVSLNGTNYSTGPGIQGGGGDPVIHNN
ncbi:MAG TPA: hypothetical protein VFE67_01615 [Rudaea sp.]|jgi:hypothetical protein|nr:hypothetical protein [Rudaea sp.]